MSALPNHVRSVGPETLLAFGAMRLRGQREEEDKFRLYARLTIALVGCVAKDLPEAKRLSYRLRDELYGKVDAAVRLYATHKSKRLPCSMAENQITA